MGIRAVIFQNTNPERGECVVEVHLEAGHVKGKFGNELRVGGGGAHHERVVAARLLAGNLLRNCQGLPINDRRAGNEGEMYSVFSKYTGLGKRVVSKLGELTPRGQRESGGAMHGT